MRVEGTVVFLLCKKIQFSMSVFQFCLQLSILCYKTFLFAKDDIKNKLECLSVPVANFSGKSNICISFKNAN